jgi:hypothetical protein
MKTFLGMPLCKRMSDADLVDRTRRNLKWFKRVAWIHLIVLVALSIFIPKFYIRIVDTIGDMPDNDFRKHAWLGLAFGVVMGCVLAMYITKATEAIVMGFDLLQVNRKDRLLVKYHDMLKQGHVTE